MSSESIAALEQTPNIDSIQEMCWPVHCNDFMTFIGRWQSEDFTTNSGDGNGKRLFLEMTPQDLNHLWDEFDLSDNESTYTWNEEVRYYAFKCTKCQKLRGTWDMF